MSSWINTTLNRMGSKISLYSTIILSITFAVLLVFIATRKFTIQTFMVMVIIAIIFYILVSSSRGQNLEGSLPSVTYPIPPHLGHDGITLQNLYPNVVGYGVQ